MRKSFPNAYPTSSLSPSTSPLPQQASTQTLINIDNTNNTYNNDATTSYMHNTNTTTTTNAITTRTSSTTFQKDDKSLWVPDEQADICYECGNKFILVIRRKHHCRICGRIYCHDCCMKIPNENDNSELRVCNSCYKINIKLNNTLKSLLVDVSVSTPQTKLDNYVITYNNSVSRINKFSQLDNDKDETIQLYNIRLNETYLNLVKSAIKKVLDSSTKFNDLYLKWGDLLLKLTTEAIENISPSCQDLNDTINITEYIKVKTVLFQDNSMSRVIDGYAFQKNVVAKKMKKRIENPKVLLLGCSPEDDDDDMNKKQKKINPSSTQQSAYGQILRKKILQSKPNVMLIEEHNEQAFQNFSYDNEVIGDISLVVNVKKKILEKIARCTRTFVLPCADILRKNTPLGTCKLFTVEKIKNGNIQQQKGGLNLRVNEYNLMIFEGCGNVLYKTILLSGNNKEELKEIKQLLKSSLLLTVRDLFLQKNMLKCFNVDVFNISRDTSSNYIYNKRYNNKKEDDDDYFKDNDSNNNTKQPVTTVNTVCDTITNESVADTISTANDFYNGFDTEILKEGESMLSLTQLTISHSKHIQDYKGFVNVGINQSQSYSRLTSMSISMSMNSEMLANMPQRDTTESEILKSVPNMCGLPNEVSMFFYSKDVNEEKPLGNLIIDLCDDKDNKCDICGETKYKHSYLLYNKQGRIIISILNENDAIVSKYINDTNNALNNKSNNKKSNNTNDNDNNNENDYNNNNNVKQFYTNDDGVQTYNNNNNETNAIIKKESNDYIQQQQQTNTPNEDNNIYSYGYCEICKAIVTPIIILSKELFNYSASKFYKHILFNHDISNYKRIIKDFEGANICDHFLYREISRVFVTQSASIKFNYEPIKRYLFVDSQANINYDQIEKEKQTNVAEFLDENITIAIEMLFKLKEHLSGLLSQIEGTPNTFLLEQCNKIKDTVQIVLAFICDLMKRTEQLKGEMFPNILKATVVIKDLFEKVVQMKVVNNLLAKIMKKIRAMLFWDDVKNKYNEMQKEVQDKEGNGVNDNNNNNEDKKEIQNESNNNNNGMSVTNTNDNNNSSTNTNVDKTNIPLNDNNSVLNNDNKKEQEQIEQQQQDNNNNNNETSLDSIIKEEYEQFLKKEDLINNTLSEIDNSKQYTHILDLLKFHDNNHSKYSHKIQPNDICSVIAYLLSSDRYIEYISSNNKIQLTEIKRKNIQSTSSKDIGLFKTSLLFDPKDISFTHDKPIPHEKIKQQLEPELLSDEKTNFTFEFANDFNKFINDSFKNKENYPLKLKSSSDLKDNLKINAIDLREQYNNTKIDLELIYASIKKKENEDYAELKLKYKYPKYHFIEKNQNIIKGNVIAYYPKQFEALRLIYTASHEEFLLSMLKSNLWTDVSGGKSKANFYKSHDNKYIIKCITKSEFEMFLESGFHYFHHINKYFFYKMPTALSKVLGAYKIKLKTPTKSSIFCVLMENLYHHIINDDTIYEAYDLKGSNINRLIPLKDIKPRRVLQDTNFIDNYKGEPLCLDKEMFTLFDSAIKNDSLILSKMNVVDYSLLLIIVDEPANMEVDYKKVNENENGNGNVSYIKVGVIDYFRKYTWDKSLESLGKKIMHKFTDPTIINPVNYKKRFLEKISNYFIAI